MGRPRINDTDKRIVQVNIRLTKGERDKALTKYVVEIPGKSVELAERHHLSAETQLQEANSIQKIL